MQTVEATPQLDLAFQEALLITGAFAGDHPNPMKRTMTAFYHAFPEGVLNGHLAKDSAFEALLGYTGKQIPAKERRRLFNLLQPWTRLDRAQILLDQASLDANRYSVLQQSLEDMRRVLWFRLQEWGFKVQPQDPELAYASVMARSMDPTPQQEVDALLDSRALALDRAGFPVGPGSTSGESIVRWIQAKSWTADKDPTALFEEVRRGFIAAMREPLQASSLPESIRDHLLNDVIPGMEIRHDPNAPYNFSGYLGNGVSALVMKGSIQGNTEAQYQRLLEHEMGHALQTALADRLYQEGHVGVESQMGLMPSAAVTFQEGFADGFVPLICGGATVEEMIQNRGADYALVQVLVRVRNMIAHDGVRARLVERRPLAEVKEWAQNRYGVQDAKSLDPYGPPSFDLLYGGKANHCGVKAVDRVVAKLGFKGAFDRALHCSGFMDVNAFTAV
jgi:hypothetical protein